MWLQNSSCMELIKKFWVELVNECPMLILQHKLQSLKVELKGWNKFEIGNIQTMVAHEQQCHLDI